MDYVEMHLNENITLDKAVQIECFSSFLFHRIFSTITRETISAFIQRIRIEKAAQLIQNDKEISIGEIAFKCGFNSSAHFSRSFRKHFGLTAKAFRESEKAIFAKGGLWFTESGYQPSDGYPYELYCNSPDEDLKHRFVLDICILVKTL